MVRFLLLAIGADVSTAGMLKVVWKKEEGLDGLVNELPLSSVCVVWIHFLMLLVSDINVRQSFREWLWIGNGFWF